MSGWRTGEWPFKPGDASVVHQHIKDGKARRYRIPIGFDQERRAWFLWLGFQVLNGLAFAPFRLGLGVVTNCPAQMREQSLQPLYCSFDGVRGRGAPVTNLSPLTHSADVLPGAA